MLYNGGVFIWEPSRQLVQVDINLEKDPRQRYSHNIVSPPLIIHPTEPGTFFVVTCYPSRPWPTVHEITPKARGYAVSRVFTYSPPDLPGLSGLSDLSTKDPDLEVRRVDDQGTFQLMEWEILHPKKTTETKPYNHRYLTFNILTKEFSTQSYLSPLEPHRFHADDDFSGRDSCIWGGQLILLCNQDFDARPIPLLVALDQRPSSQPFLDRVCKEFERVLQQSAPGLYDNFGCYHTDIVRHDDITVQYPAALDCRAILGFQYALRPFAGACTYGGGHKSSCQSGTAASLPHGVTLSTFAKSLDRSRQAAESASQEYCDICMDGDFMVIFTANNYTVYCVDADGKLAATMQHELRDRS